MNSSAYFFLGVYVLSMVFGVWSLYIGARKGILINNQVYLAGFTSGIAITLFVMFLTCTYMFAGRH